MKSKAGVWMGRPILDAAHAKDLDLSAAIHEFHHGLDRATAEHKAWSEYKHEHHARAAAHHLNGMKSARASGSHEDAQKHYSMYAEHVKALGYHEYDAVPATVSAYANEHKEGAHTFAGHGADQLLLASHEPPSSHSA
jgi:hypothetical protein